MVITDNKKLRDIQNEFNKVFPFLKIEFYSGAHHSGEGSHIEDRLNPESLLKDIREIHSKEGLVIREEMKVSEFEKSFLQKYGLNVQVFRKSGNLWMQTTATDFWTLMEQNRKGSSSTNAFRNKYNN